MRFPSESRVGDGGPRGAFDNWRTNLLYPLFQLPGPRDPPADDGGKVPGYAAEGFLTLQSMINQVRFLTNFDTSQ